MPARHRRPGLPLAIACTLLTSTACGPRIAPIDTGKPLTDADLALAFSKGGSADADDFSEQLVMRADLEDDASVYVKLTVTNLASADGRADLTVAVTLPGGRKVQLKERRDRGEWRFDKERFFAEVGAGSVALGVGYARVSARGDEFALDFELTTTLPPLRPKGGLYDRGGRFYVTTIPIPRGAAKARVELFGPPPEPSGGEDEARAPEDEPPAEEPPAEDTPRLGDAPVSDPDGDALSLPAALELDGVGYAEHRATNVPPYDMARRWYSIVDLGEDETVFLSAFEHAAPEGVTRDPQAPPGPVQGFFYATSDDRVLLYEQELDLKVRGWSLDDQTSYPIPEIVFVTDPKRTGFEGVIAAGPLSERKDDLQSLKRLERIIVKKFMKPWTFRFDRARYLFRRQNPGEGMREIRGEKRLQVQQLN